MLLGITQEQDPDRCRLLAQWKGFGWPILHDPINIMGSRGVPVLVAIDEHGIVRDTAPRLDRFQADFLNRSGGAKSAADGVYALLRLRRCRRSVPLSAPRHPG